MDQQTPPNDAPPPVATAVKDADSAPPIDDAAAKTAVPGSAPTGRGAPNARSRRWLYGANTAVIVLIVLVGAGVIDYLSTRFNKPIDCTTGHIYSLAPQTRQLLKQINKKKQTYLVASEFGSGNEGSRVREMIRQFANRSRFIKFYHPDSRAALDEQIRKRYGGELRPYRVAAKLVLREVPKLRGAFQTLAAGAKALRGEPALSAREKHWAGTIAATSGALQRRMARIQGRIAKTLHRKLPHWPRTIQYCQTYLLDVSNNLPVLMDPKFWTQTGPHIKTFLKARLPELKKMLAETQAMHNRLDGLKPLKLTNVTQQLAPNSLIVLGPRAVKVIDQTHLFIPPPPGAAKQGATSLFKGEQQLASALLAMSQRHKTTVVFVAVGQKDIAGPSGPFTSVVRLLKENNFKVDSWSPPDAALGPQAQGDPTPPAIGKGVVWIVFAPPPPNPQMMVPGAEGNKQLVALVQKQLSTGGSAMFLIDGVAANPMMGVMPEYPFTGILAHYGISVKPGFFIVKRYPNPNGVGHVTVPYILMSKYPNTAITEPLQTLQSLFAGRAQQGGPVQMGPTVVDVARHLPAHTVARVILRTSKSVNIWAESQSGPGFNKFVSSQDIASPLSMGVAARNGNSRIVTIGNSMFMIDSLTAQRGLVMTSEGPAAVRQYPANEELVLNAVRWLAGYKNMIAVSPRATVALRIQSMGGKSTAIRWASAIGPGLLILVIGATVFFVRRR